MPKEASKPGLYAKYGYYRWMSRDAVPLGVVRALGRLGDDLTTWRKLRQLTISELADRAGVGSRTVIRLENGEGATIENLLRVTRALGVMESVEKALDPFATDVGRMRAGESLPKRVHRRKSP